MDTMTSTWTRPDDPGYDDARASWNLTFDLRPAVVAEPASVEEVVHAVRQAAELGLGLVVQTTGHGAVATADEGTMLISTRRLDSVLVDPAEGTATLGGGVTWDPVLAAGAEHGLAPVLGSAPGVGAVGFTLGGGLGWLGRRHGLAVDRVRELTVVLAGGEVVTATPEQNRDLFWALLGAGGGSLGVVVSMTVQLAPVSEVYAGNLLYPIEAAADVLAHWRTWVEEVGPDLTSSFLVMTFPDMDAVPPPLRGQSFAIVRGCHCGDLAAGAAAVDRWRSWRAPVADLFGPMPFAAMANISQDPTDPVPALTSGHWLREVDDSVLPAMLAQLADGALFAEVRQAGGAVSRPNPSVSYGVRDAACTLEGVFITPTPEVWAHARASLDRMVAATRSAHHALPGYLNFVEGAERREVFGLAFDARTRERLAQVKRELDPTGLFGHGVEL